VPLGALALSKCQRAGAPIKIPFRWVQSIGDIVILKHFPRDLPIKGDDEMGGALPQYED